MSQALLIGALSCFRECALANVHQLNYDWPLQIPDRKWISVTLQIPRNNAGNKLRLLESPLRYRDPTLHPPSCSLCSTRQLHLRDFLVVNKMSAYKQDVMDSAAEAAMVPRSSLACHVCKRC